MDEGPGVTATLLARNAKWHKSCRNKVNSLKLQRLQKKSQSAVGDSLLADSEVEPDWSLPNDAPLLNRKKSCDENCIFCDGPGKANDVLHKMETYAVDARVRYCAHALQDQPLLVKLSGFDVIAANGKYHAKCLAALYNRIRRCWHAWYRPSLCTASRLH